MNPEYPDVGGIHKLQILRNELDIDQARRRHILGPSGHLPFFPPQWRGASPARRRRSLRGRAAGKHLANSRLDLGSNPGVADTTRARVNAICSQVQASFC